MATGFPLPHYYVLVVTENPSGDYEIFLSTIHNSREIPDTHIPLETIPLRETTFSLIFPISGMSMLLLSIAYLRSGSDFSTNTRMIEGFFTERLRAKLSGLPGESQESPPIDVTDIQKLVFPEISLPGFDIVSDFYARLTRPFFQHIIAETRNTVEGLVESAADIVKRYQKKPS